MQILSFLLLFFSSIDNYNIISDLSPDEIMVQDSLCEGGGFFCSDCETAIINGCFISDSLLLSNGIFSCTPEYMGPGPQMDQPSPLCFGAGVPHNMSWFAFEASDTMAHIIIDPFQCSTESGGIGLQSGVYDFCSPGGGTCIGGEPFCSNGLDPIDYYVDNMIPGNTYYLFVDGCNGAECDFEIIINPAPICLIDTPKELSVESSCPPVDNVPTFCSFSDIEFNITHFGDSPSFTGIYDDEDSAYNPVIPLVYRWKVIPPLVGTDTFFTTTQKDENLIENIVKENADAASYEICLDLIQSECDAKLCDNCCINIAFTDCGDDYDQDGFSIDEDCNDCDASINPDAVEIVGNDIDENCDGDLEGTSTSNPEIYNFNLFPNPFVDEIHFSSTYPGALLVNIYDAQGILVASQKSEKSVLLSHLPSGTYVLKINFPTEDSVIVRKILKL